MFDIGFFEIGLIATVTLIVVGPEKLPIIAKKAGLMLGRTKHFVSQIKTDIDQQIKAEELKTIFDEQAKITGLEEILEERLDLDKEKPAKSQLKNSDKID